MKKIVIIAGDSSGDIYGSLLAKRLSEKNSALKIFSFAGNHCAKYSHQTINLLEHSVSGIIEVFSSLKRILSVFKRSFQEIQRIKPDLIILIDFPDFNLRLAKKLQKQFPIFYYVSPQVWAWRRGRIKLIKKYIDKMIVIFRFEKEFYKKENIDVLYFGHPLLDLINREEMKPNNVISLLPGSRKSEIKRHLPIMHKVKEILQKQLPGWQFRIIKPQNISHDFYRKLSDINTINHSYQSIQESKFIIASSGTATLELAILRVPHIIIYKLNFFTWEILKRIVNTEFIGIVNILNKRKVVEELLQNDATPTKIATLALKYLNNKLEYTRMKNDFLKTKELLGPKDSTNKLADFLINYLNVPV